MNIELNKAQIMLDKILCKENININVEGELVVPDIKPDILSISNIDAEVYLRKQEVKEGRVYIEGVADISAIYIGEDARNSIKSLSNEIEFTKQLEIQNLPEDCVLNTKIQRKQIEFRVVNGRKIKVCISMEAEVIAIGKSKYSFVNEINNDDNFQYKKTDTNIVKFEKRDSQDVEINETVTLPSESLPIEEVLKATIIIKNIDYKLSYNKILAKADAIIKLIYISDSNKINVEDFETTIPIMGFINSENINENAIIKIEAGIKEFTIRPIYHDSKSTSFQVESIVEMIADIYKEEKIEVISDLYNPNINLKCEYEKITIVNEKIKNKEEIEMLQGLTINELENIKILDIKPVLKIKEKKVMDSKVVLEGDIEFDVIIFNEIKNIIETKKVELPYQQVLMEKRINANMDIKVEAKIERIEYKKTDDSQLQIKFLISFEIEGVMEKEIVGISELTVSEEPLLEIPSIVIYYVQKGDSLWDIAKKFRTTISELVEFNDIKEENICEGMQILIQKRTSKAIGK